MRKSSFLAWAVFLLLLFPSWHWLECAMRFYAIVMFVGFLVIIPVVYFYEHSFGQMAALMIDFGESVLKGDKELQQKYRRKLQAVRNDGKMIWFTLALISTVLIASLGIVMSFVWMLIRPFLWLSFKIRCIRNS